MEKIASDSQHAESLNRVFAALADGTRRDIILRLSNEDATVSALAEVYPISQPAISKHLKVLEDAGLVSRNHQGTKRFAHLEVDELQAGIEWMQSVKAFWESSFDQLEQLIENMKKGEINDD